MEEKRIYEMTPEEALAATEAQKEGLSSGEAGARFSKYGPNELTEEGKKSVAVIFLEQFKDLLVLILFAAAGISLVLGDIESAGVIAAVLILNAVLGTIQHLRAEQSLSSLKALSAPNAKVRRDGSVQVIDKSQVTIGDILILEAGDFICADGRLVENYSLQVNESALTGESTGVDKALSESAKGAAIGDRKNMVHSGSFVTYGRAAAVVTAIGMDTELGHVAGLLKEAENKKTPLQVSLDEFAKKLSIGILFVCAVVFGLNVLRGGGVFDAFLFAVALAVAAIPEALSSIVTIVLAFGTQKMAKEHAIIRKLYAVEGLGSVSVICSDKTGTLTQNKMTVQKYFVDFRTVARGQEQLADGVERKLMLCMVLANDAVNQEGKEIGDPTEIALINYGDACGFEDAEMKRKYPRLLEIPFDSDRKLMSTVHELFGERLLVTKGAVDVLLARCTRIETASGIAPLAEQDKERIFAANESFSKSGLRVLAFGVRTYEKEGPLTLEDEQDYTFLGLVAMMDPPREESKDAVHACIRAGIRPVMITGDHLVTASAIAKEIGILQEGEEAVSGAELDGMTDDALRERAPQIAVYARVSPEHKIRIVRAWQERGHAVAMTGDGVNDAPALKQADIGIAMGITGSEVAKDAAAMILTDDNFATIVKAVENGRNLFQNIQCAISFLLSGNTAAILCVLFASIFALPVPFAPVHLLFINLLTDSLPAIALGLEPHTGGVMQKPPRRAGESILTKQYLFAIAEEGLILAVFTACAFLFGLSRGGAALGSTMAFGALCFCRLLHGFNSKKESIYRKKALFNNKYLWYAFGCGALLLGLVLFVAPLQAIFKVTPMSFFELAVLVGLCVLSWLSVSLLRVFKEKQ